MKLGRRQWHPTPVLLPGKSHGRRSLVGCSPWGCQESDTTEQIHFHFSLSCTGEGNGSPLQCSCLENPRDGGAWWAAVYGVAQSWTQLKRLSCSSNMKLQGVTLQEGADRPPPFSSLCFCLEFGYNNLDLKLTAATTRQILNVESGKAKRLKKPDFLTL